ncbi:MAG: hypothetical protein K2N56_01730 [Oscillospiraceae bacterium]|nr:hypothetical protein [Oscillospiraceae bacterium]
MWGVCLDHSAAELFQTVIQYEVQNEKAVISKSGMALDLKHIKPLRDPPEFVFDSSVSFINHPELMGKIAKICWHFNRECYYYKISVNGKMKSRRYFADELDSTDRS